MKDHWGSDSVKREWCIGHLTLAFEHLNFFFFLNREYISGRWGKLSFPTQYESWSVPNNISGGDIYDFLGSDVYFYGDGL